MRPKARHTLLLPDLKAKFGAMAGRAVDDVVIVNPSPEVQKLIARSGMVE